MRRPQVEAASSTIVSGAVAQRRSILTRLTCSTQTITPKQASDQCQTRTAFNSPQQPSTIRRGLNNLFKLMSSHESDRTNMAEPRLSETTLYRVPYTVHDHIRLVTVRITATAPDQHSYSSFHAGDYEHITPQEKRHESRGMPAFILLTAFHCLKSLDRRPRV